MPIRSIKVVKRPEDGLEGLEFDLSPVPLIGRGLDSVVATGILERYLDTRRWDGKDVYFVTRGAAFLFSRTVDVYDLCQPKVDWRVYEWESPPACVHGLVPREVHLMEGSGQAQAPFLVRELMQLAGPAFKCRVSCVGKDDVWSEVVKESSVQRPIVTVSRGWMAEFMVDKDNNPVDQLSPEEQVLCQTEVEVQVIPALTIEKDQLNIEQVPTLMGSDGGIPKESL